MTMEFIFAKREDTEEILTFIKELADYEHMLDEVVADVPTLEHLPASQSAEDAADWNGGVWTGISRA